MGAGGMPVPASATVCGLCGLVALSVILTVPVRVPVAVGEKVTFMVQLAPAVTLPTQLSVSAKSEAFAPLKARPETVNATLPVLLKVMPLAGLANPTISFVNVRPFAERLAIREGSIPVPASRAASWLPVTLLVMVSAPVRLPAAAGVKVTLMVQLAPAATLPTQLSVSEKSEEFVPLTAMLVMLSAVD